MCGIAGLTWTESQRPVEPRLIEAMCQVMWHRGPDDGGVYTRRNVGLGHRRLAILDLTAAGHQPMRTADGRFTLIFNGEIYNYLELRDELRRHGCVFHTGTDTEVLLQAFRHWGPDCVRRFNGMWAFAVYDAVEESLFLSRDRFGIKPLYLLQDGEAFAFASEIKALLEVRPEQRRPNWNHLVRFLQTGMRDDGPQTAFENVRSLPAAHNARYNTRTGELKLSRYWTVDAARSESVSVDDAPQQLRELLQSAIRLHLRSDVPVGTCLSGGLDSSTIVGMTARELAKPVYTFSALYDDPACNEGKYVDAVNRHVSTRPREVRPNPDGDLLDDLRTITWHQDEPTGSPGLYTQFHVMKAARKDVTVVLDGQGGDELFAGYLFDFVHRIRDLVSRQAVMGRMRALRLLLSIARHWGPMTAAEGWNVLFGGVLGGLKRFIRRPRSAGIDIVHPDFARQFSGSPPQRDDVPPLSSELDTSLLDQVMTSSLPTLLHYEDRNSMAFSLESRVPLLDYRLVEFAFSVVPEAKIHGSWTKWCLRKVAENYVPRNVAWRRSKMGYPTPIDRWLRQPRDRDAVADALFSSRALSRGLIDPQRLRRTWTEHLNGINHGWLLYRVLTTNLWFDQSVDAWLPHPAIPAKPMRDLRSVA